MVFGLGLIILNFGLARSENMDVTVDIGSEQPKSVLNENFIQEKASAELSEFQNFLLNAPIMDPNQYKEHKANRKYFNALPRNTYKYEIPKFRKRQDFIKGKNS